MGRMFIQQCLLRADGPIYYATREIGRLHETGDHLHNFALTYALGLANSPYHSENPQKPRYRDELSLVNEREIYVTPATPYQVDHTISTIKFGRETWQEKLIKNKNIPNYGRIKELAPGSEFIFFVLSPEPISLPKWIRLGIWLSKCEVIVTGQGYFTLTDSSQVAYSYALNPLDLAEPPETFDIIAMPPNSLIRHVRMRGSWWRGKLNDQEFFAIPASMRYLRNA